MKNKLRIMECFGGIGACSKALERLNIEHEVVDYVEIDKYAVKSYNAIHGTNFEPQDITEWDKDIEVDLIMHGSPCQDFSIAGKQAGGNKDSGTRSSLLYETVRIVEKLKPKYVIWENVKNLLSKKHRHNFDNYLNKMEQLGYTNYYQVLNAKNYGIPQNRERVFTVSIRNDIQQNFQFPKPYNDNITFRDFLEPNILNETILDYKDLAKVKYCGADYSFGGYISDGNIYNTITANYGKCSGNSMKFLRNHRITILSPLEAWKLMGFDKNDYEKASVVQNDNSKTLYKQAGNSVVVNVLEEIFKELFKEGQQ